MNEHGNNSSLLSLIKWLALHIAGPLLGLILFFIGNKGFEITNDSIFALILALIGYVIGQHVVNGFEDHERRQLISSQMDGLRSEIHKTSDAFRREMRSLFKVVHIRDSEVNEQIASSLRTAYHVKNTYVGSKEITGVKTHRSAGIIEHYGIILSKDRNATWQEIAGVGEFLDGRFAEINPDGAMQFRGTHEIFLIDTHVPVLNFLLCGPEESQFTEVYFGWVKNMTNDVDVFFSRDERLISMFNNYFDALKRTKDRVVSIPVSYTDKSSERFSKSTANRLRGTWISISGAVKAVAPSGEKPDPNKGELATYAVIDISYADDWRVQGRTYSYPTHELIYIFDTEMCVVYGNTIFYTYKNSNTYHRVESHGIGLYSLASDHDLLSGSYVKSGSNKSAMLRAKKIDSGSLNDAELMKSILEGIVKIRG